MRATISILGLTSYDESIWDNLQLPAQANKQDIIDEILLECSDFELLYPDWDVMKGAIGLWSRKELPIWERLYKAKEYEYNPLWNVDATIKEIRDVTDNSNYKDNTAGNTSQNIDEDSTIDNTNKTIGSNTRTNTEALTENIDETVDNETDGTSANTSKKTGTEQIAGTASTDGSALHQSNTFNSGTMIDNSKDITESDTTSNQTTTFNTTVTDNGTTHDEGTSTRDFDRTQSINGSESGSHTEDQTGKNVLDRNQDTKGTYDEEKTGTNSRATHDVYDVVRQGNIGVTSSQQLLTEEWEVSQLDPEQYIIDSFKQRFCLLLY